jgi:hypothetical protein
VPLREIARHTRIPVTVQRHHEKYAASVPPGQMAKAKPKKRKVKRGKQTYEKHVASSPPAKMTEAHSEISEV